MNPSAAATLIPALHILRAGQQIQRRHLSSDLIDDQMTPALRKPRPHLRIPRNEAAFGDAKLETLGGNNAGIEEMFDIGNESFLHHMMLRRPE